ncbi:MAG: hypothetical protein ACRD3O_24020, partial [Terriglobia bacterium]
MDIEKAMQFFLEMQAKHEVAVQQHDAAIQHLDERMDRTEGMLRQLVDVSLSLTHHLQQLGQHIQEVDERLGRRIEDLSESQAHSDRRLDALIDVVDKLIHRNG